MKKILLFFLALFLVLVVVSAAFTLLKKPLPLGEKIGLIRVEGPILASRETIEQFEKYRDDSSIKAIVLRVNSPGGPVVPSQEISEAVKKAVQKKKVVVSMGSLAASGGYYVSANASLIFANPGTITGSIGVIMELMNLEGMMGKIGIKSEVIKSGKYKDLASVFRALGEKEREILQAGLDDVHEQFIEAVAQGRRIPVDKVRALADGRIFTGRQALKAGLVDKLGTQEDAIKEAARLAGIKGKPKVVAPKEDFSISDILKSKVLMEILHNFPVLSVSYMTHFSGY